MKTYYLSIRVKDMKLIVDSETHGKVLFYVEAESWAKAVNLIKAKYLL